MSPVVLLVCTHNQSSSFRQICSLFLIYNSLKSSWKNSMLSTLHWISGRVHTRFLFRKLVFEYCKMIVPISIGICNLFLWNCTIINKITWETCMKCLFHSRSIVLFNLVGLSYQTCFVGPETTPMSMSFLSAKYVFWSINFTLRVKSVFQLFGSPI